MQKYSLRLTHLIANHAGLSRQQLAREIACLRTASVHKGSAFRAKQEEIFTRILSATRHKDEGGLAKPSGHSCKFKGALPWKCKGMNVFVPDVLGMDEYLAPVNSVYAEGVDIFFTWGVGSSERHLLSESLAQKFGKPLIRLEYGFISSRDIALKESPQHSLILCPDVMYYDARSASAMERLLNDASFELTKSQRQRARNCISEIVKTRVTKYNHAPSFDIDGKLPPCGKKRVLLVDQRFGDASIRMGLADQSSFQRMWDEAIKLEDHEILVKIHPDALEGGKESCLSKLLPETLPANVKIVDFDINPYALLKTIDKVFTCVSQFGFEALMSGKQVYCFGVSFYSGWGLTTDFIQPLRGRRKRNIEDVFYVFYIIYSRYYVPAIGPCEIEDLIAHFSQPDDITLAASISPSMPVLEAAPEVSTVLRPTDVPTEDRSLRVLFVIPSGRFGATGRYFQDLAWHLKRIDCEVIVLAEGASARSYSGVDWLNLEFEGPRLSMELRNKIIDFAPHIIYENGVRSRAQRAALELKLLTGAALALQSEDDDVQVYMERHPAPDEVALTVLDKIAPSSKEILDFVAKNDWSFTLSVLADPSYDRWVEPLLRTLCYHLSVLNTAIWYPFEARLKSEYGKPTMVVPPVITLSQYKPALVSAGERADLFSKHNIDAESLVLFIAGTIYDYSEEYLVFLKSLNILVKKPGAASLTLVTVSGRTNLSVESMAKNVLDPAIGFADLGAADDDTYAAFLRACDLVCSPGFPDRFNLYRLPSRLVKAMALAKPVLTSRCGFGDSLIHGVNAVLLEGSSEHAWAESMTVCFDQAQLAAIGQAGRRFAEQHFDAAPLARRLKKKFIEVLA